MWVMATTTSTSLSPPLTTRTEKAFAVQLTTVTITSSDVVITDTTTDEGFPSQDTSYSRGGNWDMLDKGDGLGMLETEVKVSMFQSDPLLTAKYALHESYFNCIHICAVLLFYI
jgi:hypothetical protein